MAIPVHKILKKCRYQDHGNTWGGYLQPAEILTLIDAGYSPCVPNGWEIERAREDKERGICNPSWFYFVRNRKRGEWQ